MKPFPNALVEHYRVRHGPGATLDSYGANGAWRVPCGRVTLAVITSDGAGWDHVSVSLPDRCPTWEEMAHVADLFFRTDEWAVQYRPPRSLHVNNHPYCLHWFRPQTAEETEAIRQARLAQGEPWPYGLVADPRPLPVPPSWMVGVAGLSPEEVRRLPADERYRQALAALKGGAL